MEIHIRLSAYEVGVMGSSRFIFYGSTSEVDHMQNLKPGNESSGPVYWHLICCRSMNIDNFVATTSVHGLYPTRHFDPDSIVSDSVGLPGVLHYAFCVCLCVVTRLSFRHFPSRIPAMYLPASSIAASHQLSTFFFVYCTPRETHACQSMPPSINSV